MLAGLDHGPAVLDTEHYRTVMGQFPSGVTVVTAMLDATPVGLTAQAFVSLSLTPPLVVLCLSETSVTWRRIRTGGHLAINILSEEQSTLSDRFANKFADRFAGIEWTPSPVSGSPLLPGVAGWLDCDLHEAYHCGDHYVAICHVRALDLCEHTRPLLYYRGSYHLLGTEIEPIDQGDAGGLHLD
jgi:3-hydroxy-9,10-secoandrosta-1,3,5(10)-triene-9,17-dione monooxygenase reductase component